MAFIRSSIELKQNDRQVAQFLSRVKMTEKLEARVVEQLQGEGAGPKTVETLNKLREQSQSLGEAKAVVEQSGYVQPPPPPEAEQLRIVERTREYALNYSRTLPDFICAQIIRRYADPRGGESWQLLDTLTVRLSYYQQKEDYRLVMVNNKVTQQSYHQLGGSTSSGEFGTMLRDVFERRTQARFEWDHWGTLRQRPTYVFRYRVSQLNSQWHLSYERKLDIVPSYHGLIYVDRKTNQILRVTLEAEDIPTTFPIKEARTTLDYDYVEISGHTFLLPLKAQIRMRSDGVTTMNDQEFRLYRKFSTDTEIKFDTPEPLPEEQTKEQAPKK